MPEQAGPTATKVACSVCRLLAEHPPSAQPVPQLARRDTGRGSEPAGVAVLVAETGDVGDLTQREGGVAQVTCSAHLVLRSLGLLAPAAGRAVLDAESPDDLAALAIVRNGRGAELLLANLSGQDRTVPVQADGRTRTVALADWAVARLELG